MDTNEGSRIGDIIRGLEQRRWDLSRIAASFPESFVEYMALPTEERLRVARSMMEQYADVTECDPDTPSGAPATLETDNPGIKIEGRVGFLDATWKRKRKSMTLSHQPAQLRVWTRAAERHNAYETDFEALGVIEFDELNDGTPRGELLGKTEPGYGSESFGLEDSRATDMIEIINAAAKGLIEGVIDKHRRIIGSRALSGAAGSAGER